jgi:hypothetical protein
MSLGGEKKLLNLNVQFSLQTLSEALVLLRKNEQDMIKKMYIELHVKYPLFMPDFNETLIFSTDFAKNTQMSNFMKIRTVGAELFMRTDRHDKATSPLFFSQFCEPA